MAKVYLLQATPFNPTTAATVAVRLAGGGVKPYTHLGFNDWRAGIQGRPIFMAAIDFTQDGWSGGGFPQTASIDFYPADQALRSTLLGYFWIGASVTLTSADDEVTPMVFTTEMVGTVAGIMQTNGALTITMADSAQALQKNTLLDRFLGTGGLEGDAEFINRIKRRAWGRCFNVEGLALIKASNIYEFNHPSFPIQEFTLVKDMGRAASPAPIVINWAGSLAATLAALVASVPVTGSACVCPSIGCVKWWTQPSGPLTADIKGEVGIGYVEDVAYVTERLVAARSSVLVANRAAASALRPAVVGIHVSDEGETIQQSVDRLLAGSSLGWTMDANGLLRFLPFQFSGSVETLTSDSVTRDATYRPVLRRILGYSKNYRVHNASEVSAYITLAETDPVAFAKLQTIEAYAANGDNYYANSSLTDDTLNWRLVNAPARVVGGPGAKAYFEFSVGADRYAQANDASLTGLDGTGKLYFSTWVFNNAGGAGTWQFEFAWYKADGSASAVPSSTLDLRTGIPTNNWYFYNVAFDPPADAVQFTSGYHAATVTGAPVNASAPRLAKSQIGADVTGINTAATIKAIGSYVPTLTNIVFNYTSTTTSVSITWAAATVYRPDGTQIAIAAGSFAIGGFGAPGSYNVYPYIADTGASSNVVSFVQAPGTGSGAPPAAYQSSAQKLIGSTVGLATANISLGSFTFAIPAAGSGSGSGGGGSGACVDVDSILPSGQRAGDVAVGDPVFLLLQDDSGYFEYPVEAIRFDEAPCFRIYTDSGISLVCSDTTPITTRGGEVVDIHNALGVEVPVLDRGYFRWERICYIEPLGPRRVALISANNGTYAAGEHDDDRFIFTHNVNQKYL